MVYCRTKQYRKMAVEDRIEGGNAQLFSTEMYGVPRLGSDVDFTKISYKTTVCIIVKIVV